jgi:hypothetical protein
MILPFYEFSSVDDITFQFASVGPNGRIQKAVLFTETQLPGIWNLGFGDVDPLTGEISDMARSNNNDMKTVLVTVARTVLVFFATHPDAAVFLTGSTPARTRLYQREINIYFDEISPLFHIRGLREGQLESYSPDAGYDAFLGVPR